MKPYKVLYHVGESIDLKTSVKEGQLTLNQEALCINDVIEVSYQDIASIELFRLNGLGRMLKIQLSEGKILFVSVIRFLVLGLFAVINYKKTGILLEAINEKVRMAT